MGRTHGPGGFMGGGATPRMRGQTWASSPVQKQNLSRSPTPCVQLTRIVSASMGVKVKFLVAAAGLAASVAWPPVGTASRQSAAARACRRVGDLVRACERVCACVCVCARWSDLGVGESVRRAPVVCVTAPRGRWERMKKRCVAGQPNNQLKKKKNPCALPTTRRRCAPWDPLAGGGSPVHSPAGNARSQE